MSYEQKRDLQIVLSSNMISWEFVTVISAFCNFYIFYRRLYTTPFFSVSFSDEHRATNDQYLATKEPEILVHLRKLRHQHLKCLNKCMQITQCHELEPLSGTRGSKRGARRWKMTPGVGGLQRGGFRWISSR